jgi:hypothetical protein
MIRTSESTKQLLAALAEFHARTPQVVKDSVNPHFGNRYASVGTIRRAIAPYLQEVGLVLSQWPCGMPDGSPGLDSHLAHVSGEWMACASPLVMDKNNSQGQGSGLTYMTRYSTCAILGITADEDDDANAASQGTAIAAQPSAVSRAVPNQPEYQEVNGEQIPTGYTDDPIVRTGPGGVDATSITEKQGKMVYAVTKANYGGDADVKSIVSRLVGRPINRTEEVWVSELDGLVAKLKMKA